ncbi:uncharacterized protein TNIN_307251 [Trichonephila inaurata madagascariensis]|uniref:Uncharacterized protein n=1 Tax=Trichonephila inaurata madagascariensis TaxID=2747483 RepID=A0A8X6YA45_9ARAC|nr:uncharacterized protein TNIN_307251 [Trichonephila inaurata madagascariensis]
MIQDCNPSSSRLLFLRPRFSRLRFFRFRSPFSPGSVLRSGLPQSLPGPPLYILGPQPDLVNLVRPEFLEGTNGPTTAFSENDRDRSKIRDFREQTNEAIFSKRNVACKILKGLILILCISCFLYQSANFFVLYFTYPTTLSLAVTNPEVIIKPALTFCISNLINRTYFCTEYPNLCTEPSNVTEFCEKYPLNCNGNNSNLLIPDSEELEGRYIVKALEAVQRLHLDYIHGRSKRNPWSLRNLCTDRDMKENFIFDQYTGFYSMCYSSNLRLDDNAEPEKWNKNSSPRGVRNMIDYFTLQMPNNESFLYENAPKIIFSVHSPFVRDDPRILQNELKFGRTYEVNVRLKEEHLLQHPYPTDCTDYEDLWRKNNKTGPRSQEVVLIIPLILVSRE